MVGANEGRPEGKEEGGDVRRTLGQFVGLEEG
jgi:hypothetical protein